MTSKNAFKALLITPRQGQILRMFYGIGYARRKSQTEIAHELGITAPAARQALMKALRKIPGGKNLSPVMEMVDTAMREAIEEETA